MTSVTSISGGKTSAYLALHYPTDVNIFAVVCVDCHQPGRDMDPGLRREARKRLEKTSPQWPEFQSTTEDPATLRAVLDLEQLLGREIVWVRGMGWEEMMQKRKAVPNKQKRFCTGVMKMDPIFWYLYMNHGLPVKMQLGYRYDEQERGQRASTLYKFSPYCELTGRVPGRHRWHEIQWRENSFPLIDDRITHYHVKQFWEGKGIKFPPDSNCQNCFWKRDQQLRKNWDTNPKIMQWAAIQEDLIGHTFRDRPLASIQQDAIQLDFAFGGGAGCSAGFCTD